MAAMGTAWGSARAVCRTASYAMDLLWRAPCSVDAGQPRAFALRVTRLLGMIGRAIHPADRRGKQGLPGSPC